MLKRYSIFADYFQFYLWDREASRQAPEDYTDEDIERRMKVGPNVVVIQPARNTTVPVELEIAHAPPPNDYEKWDHVAEASLDLPSGKLQLHECTGGVIDDIELPPGTYRVRAYFGDLGQLSEDGLDGRDHYRIVIWPAQSEPVRVLKQYKG